MKYDTSLIDAQIKRLKWQNRISMLYFFAVSLGLIAVFTTFVATIVGLFSEY